MKALSTDKTELSKLLSVARAIPAEIVRSVGAAPGIGRRRWMALAQDWNGTTAARLAKLIGSEKFMGEESDRRFELLVAELAKKEAKPEATEYDWKPKSGGKIAGRIKSAGNSFTIALKTGDAPDFGAYISRRLDELYEAYRAGRLQAGE